MPGRPIGAVTFDLWDCLFADDTDEPKRAAAGEAPKPIARRTLLHDALHAVAPIERSIVDLAYDTADAAYRKVWHDLHVTLSVRERLEIILEGLKRTLPDAVFEELVRLHEDMELVYSPDPAPGALEALKALHGKYKIAIVSDTIFSPGKNLRKLLAKEGMLPYFDHFAFSDEAGRSKPHPDIFKSVADAFGIGLADIVHIGDRPHNDIGGPHAIGARGVLLTVVKKRDLDGHVPDAICDNYADLPAILASLEA
ncbi:MAG: HAD family hydrolase [Candidatus Hydrogenedentes bacterium]|nr:HAD family hydrolase [Candidatus Hydrogenedentota bacterium]